MGLLLFYAVVEIKHIKKSITGPAVLGWFWIFIKVGLK